MYEIAEQVRDWVATGRPVLVAQLVATVGFSSRTPAATLAWTPGEPAVGSLIGTLGPSAFDRPGFVEVPVSDADAATDGLSCGGSASVLVTAGDRFPSSLWERLTARRPVALVSSLTGVEPVSVYTPETIGSATEFGADIPRLFARGRSSADVVEHEDVRRAVITLWPVPTLLVVGDGLIADALLAAAALLGWSARATDEVDAQSLVASDAVVVLSHDRAVDGPALVAALGSRAGYVGALGSRRTQAARREWLDGHGIEDATIDRIHGPAGLDIDAHTPAEIAVSIVAEILASRSDSGGGALRDRPGPVHTAGVQAPPPRYPTARMRTT